LKFGSMIVDSLRYHKQPVFVYLPPYATLRGGAWVVVDSQINLKCIEMYAAPTARGGVLEKEGTVGVKFRMKHLKKTMHRLDPTLQSLDRQLGDEKQDAKAIKAKIAAREAELQPYYHSVATHFCDLHDTPGRMKAKGVTRDTVPWKQSRAYFYWRLRRRLAEQKLAQRIDEASSGSSLLAASTSKSDVQWSATQATVQKWMRASPVPVVDSKTTSAEDRAAAEWFEKAENKAFVEARLTEMRTSRVRELAGSDDFLEEMALLVASMKPAQKSKLMELVAKI